MSRPPGIGPSWVERYTELREGRRRLGEGRQQHRNPDRTLCDPLPDSDSFLKAWLGGHARLHLHVRFWPDLAGADECEFCADIQRVLISLPGRVSNDAVHEIRDFYVDPSGLNPDWLDRAVLVTCDKHRQHRQRVTPSVALADVVRLMPAYSCDVCPAHTGELDRQLPVELGARAENGEEDRLPLPPREIARRRLASDDKRPSEMIERASESVGNVANQEAPADRHRSDIGRVDPEPVTLSVILGRTAKHWISVGMSAPDIDISLKRLGVEYALPPLEPRAVEEWIVLGGDG